MKKFVIGDIHGGYKALEQCLDRSGFDDNKDLLISLGDVCDGWPETKECINRLLKIKHEIHCLGNHDDWASDWMRYGSMPSIWTSQGGMATLESYDLGKTIPEEHINYLSNSVLKYEDNNCLFVHAGFNWYVPIEENDKHEIIWDRNLFNDAIKHPDNVYGKYEEIFIGHTTTSRFSDIPIKYANVWFLDQGAGWEGKLSIMNIDTHEFWQSDKVETLYPKYHGRRK